MRDDSSRFVLRQVTDAEQIDAALAAIADEPYMEMYHDSEFRRKHAEKLAQRAYVFVDYYDDQPAGVFAFYANDFETRVAYAIVLAFRSSLGLQKIRAIYQIREVMMAVPALAQMRRIRMRVNINNQHARKLYEQFGLSYTGERVGDKLYMEADIASSLQLIERIVPNQGSFSMHNEENDESKA